MEANELIEKFQDFLETTNYKADLAEVARLNKSRLSVSYKDLIRYTSEFDEALLLDPEETLKAFELACRQYDFNLPNIFSVRIKDTPESINFRVRDKRSTMLNKFITFEGIVESKSDVRMNICSTKFECGQCGNIINILQTEKKFKEPTKCACGRVGKFKELSQEVIDAFSIKLQELPEQVNFDPELKSLHVIFSKDLTESKIEERIFQGIRIKITGILKEVEIQTRTGGKSTTLDYLLDVNYVDITENKFYDLKINEEEHKQIKKIAENKDAVSILGNKIFHSIYGYDDVKKGITLMLFAGVSNFEDIPKERGEPHILLIGDPGEGKTDFLKITQKYCLKSKYVSGVSATGVGLAGAVEQDKIVGGYTFKAGPIVLCNKGVCCIDEFNELGYEEKNIMREPMESCEITITKASISRHFVAQESFLVSSNPKHGTFDSSDEMAAQFSIPSPVLSRFDLIYIFKTTHDEEFEEKKATLMLNRKNKKIEIEPEFFKKYLSLSKKIDPEIPKELKIHISKIYAKMKTNLKQENVEGGKQFPITPRYVNIIKRLSEAKARIHLRKIVYREDVDFVMDLIYDSLKSFISPDSGKVDTFFLETGHSSSSRSLSIILLDVVEDLSKEEKSIPIQKLIEEIQTKGDYKVHQIEEAIDREIRAGGLMESRHGFLQKI